MTCMTSISEPTAATSSPDWNMIQEDILCPLCEYDLRMLTEPRCPECGYRFEWPDVLDPSRRLHRYLFEHHPERNWWSFWKTALGGLQPRTFWTALQPVQPSNPKRLLLYWILTVALALLGLSVHYVRACISTHQSMMRMRSILSTTPPARGWDIYLENIVIKHGSLEAAFEAELPLPPSIGFFWSALFNDISIPVLVGLLFLFLSWPWLTFLGLLVFRWSMRQARIKAVHVARCVVYNSDVTIWWTLAMSGTTLTTFLVTQSAALSTGTLIALALLCTVLYMLSTYRLWMAYRKYLRFPHPFLTILASQVMVLLVVAKAFFLFMHGFSGL